MELGMSFLFLILPSKEDSQHDCFVEWGLSLVERTNALQRKRKMLLVKKSARIRAFGNKIEHADIQPVNVTIFTALCFALLLSVACLVRVSHSMASNPSSMGLMSRPMKLKASRKRRSMNFDPTWLAPRTNRYSCRTPASNRILCRYSDPRYRLSASSSPHSK